MYLWIGLVLLSLVVVWLIWGGRPQDFVGLDGEEIKRLRGNDTDKHRSGESLSLPDAREHHPPTEYLPRPTKPNPTEPNPTEEQPIEEHPGTWGPGSEHQSLHRVYKQRQSKGEKICCGLMEKIYRRPFYTVRPDFLRNPETGRNLEIDCYNPELKIGAEYNGKQHYVFPNYTGMSRKEFLDQVRRDRFKKEACDRHGVYLITVPYHVPHDQIEEFIRARLPYKN